MFYERDFLIFFMIMANNHVSNASTCNYRFARFVSRFLFFNSIILLTFYRPIWGVDIHCAIIQLMTLVYPTHDCR